MLRNQACGRMWIGAVAGPRLCTVIRIRMSSGVSLGVFHLDVEVAILIEQPGVDQLEFALARAFPVARSRRSATDMGMLPVAACRASGVSVARNRIEIVIKLLDVFAMVALLIGQAEQPLLQDRVASVPERKREAEQLPVVGEPGDAVLAPAIGPAARLIVRRDNPRRCRLGCSPRAPCPIAVR